MELINGSREVVQWIGFLIIAVIMLAYFSHEMKQQNKDWEE